MKQRKQRADDSFDTFVKGLRLILRDCEHAGPDNILIDVIVDGVKEKKAQKILLDVEDALTSAKAIQIGQQYELSQSKCAQSVKKMTPLFMSSTNTSMVKSNRETSRAHHKEN